ncbi:hypothetical protein Ancab_022383 [Ancistrocladus abbreviatus]
MSSSKLLVDFSPPLIAMVIIAAAAFLVVTYSHLISRHLFPPLLRLLRHYRRWRRRQRPHPRLPSLSHVESPPYEPSDEFCVYSPYGLDESMIKTMPLSIYTTKNQSKESPFVPVMAARIRPSLDEGLLLESMFLETLPEASPMMRISDGMTAEIVSAMEMVSSPGQNQSEDRGHIRDCLLKRSYSFGFERNFLSERLMLELEPANGISVAVPSQGKLLEKAVTVQLTGEIKSFLVLILWQNQDCFLLSQQ